MQAREVVLNCTWWSTAIAGAIVGRTQFELHLVIAIIAGVGVGLSCVLGLALLLYGVDRRRDRSA